jgi:nitrite reductase (cytochrome c-552)
LVATFGLGVLATSILERRQEARSLPILQPISAEEVDSAKWATNFPRQYDAYARQADPEQKTRYGGPFLRDYLEETPANVILFAGSLFGRDYRQARGHRQALRDLRESGRLTPATPATCWTCKSPDVLPLLGKMKPERFYATRFDQWQEQMRHTIGCYDCHEPNTMKLRVVRPALAEALKARGHDLTQATHQEMRSLVCAQCHVEYHFQPGNNYLVFPWRHGLGAEQMERYYEDEEFADWRHAISKARMLKAQHPDYELYTKGIHAYRNVACADCHMPYRSEGGAKFSNHQVQSPLLDVDASCGVCHRWGRQQIIQRVEQIQDTVRETRERVEAVLALAHFDVAAAEQAGVSQEELAGARNKLRAAQFRWDFVAAANGMGFHAPQESLRLLAAAIELAGQCRLDCARLLAKKGFIGPVVYPDFSSKEKAQAVVQQFLAEKPPSLLPTRQ